MSFNIYDMKHVVHERYESLTKSTKVQCVHIVLGYIFIKDFFLIHDIDDDALDMFFVLTKLLHIHTIQPITPQYYKTLSTHTYVYILHGSCFTYSFMIHCG